MAIGQLTSVQVRQVQRGTRPSETDEVPRPTASRHCDSSLWLGRRVAELSTQGRMNLSCDVKPAFSKRWADSASERRTKWR